MGALAAIMITGCRSEDNYTPVNFSKTISVASPNFEQQESRQLRVEGLATPIIRGRPFYQSS
jgi:hypothetical protein